MTEAQTCPRCSSAALNVEMRDPGDSPNPPRNSYGTWFVCRDCGKEWPEDDPINPFSDKPDMAALVEKHRKLIDLLGER